VLGGGRLHPGGNDEEPLAYAASKCVDEFLALAYHAEMSLPVFIVRLFNTVDRARQAGTDGAAAVRAAGVERERSRSTATDARSAASPRFRCCRGHP